MDSSGVHDRSGRVSIGAAAVFALAAVFGVSPAVAAPTVIELTQVPCQFVESEGGDGQGGCGRLAAGCSLAAGGEGADDTRAGIGTRECCTAGRC